MPSIDLIKASDGSGNAAVATVQNSRSPGSSTIVVDTVASINSTFMGSMGTPHTFVDPITAETITVISEATAVDFSGHVDGANLEIDDIAPGYSDLGSAVDDIIIIKPTTEWADNIAATLAVAHNDDGTIKNGIVTTKNLVSNLQLGWSDATDETWVYVSGTGTITGVFKITGVDLTGKYQAGDKIKFTQTQVKYGIITKVAFSTDTTITVLMSATSGTVDNSGLTNTTISANYYSRQKSPFGFPMSPAKWTVRYTYTDDNSTTSATYAQVGAHQLTLPIGSWHTAMKFTANIATSGANACVGHVALSTATNSVSDAEFSATFRNPSVSSLASNQTQEAYIRKTITVTSSTVYYQIFARDNALTFSVNGSADTGFIEAVCAYL